MRDLILIVQIALLIVVVFLLLRLLRAGAFRTVASTETPRAASLGGPAVTADLNRIHSRLDQIEATLERVGSRIGEIQKDADILDELEDNVMEEWSRIIEDKLGKRPVLVPCPNCGSEAGLEPNLLADEDREYGCTQCGAIISVDVLREKYPGLKL